MTFTFFCMLSSSVSSGADVGISPHAVVQCSDWPAAQAVWRCVKFTQRKIPICDAASHQNALTTCYQ